MYTITVLYTWNWYNVGQLHLDLKENKNWQADSKIHMELQGTQNSQTTFERSTRMKYPHISTYCVAMVIKVYGTGTLTDM